MEYKDRVKNRKLKRKLTNLVDTFKFRSVEITTGKKIVLAGLVFGFFSLFFKWIDCTDRSKQYYIGNSFHDTIGSPGLFILIIIIFLIFIILSKKNKDKIKLSIDSHIRDYIFVMAGGLYIIVSTISCLIMLKSSSMAISSVIIVGKGPIFELVSGIFILAGGIIMRFEFRKNINKIYLNNSEDEESKKDSEEENLFLPVD